MKVLSEKEIVRIRIRYNTSKGPEGLTNTLNYLDNRFGVFGYKIIKKTKENDPGSGFIVGIMVVDGNLD